MSEISELYKAFILVADFVNIDSGGKLNIIGGGVSVLGFNALTGRTADFAVIARITCVDPTRDDEAAVELILADSSGETVQLPSGDGQSQALRVAQNFRFEPATAHGVTVPKGALDSSNQMILNFYGGLPLSPGLTYTWRLHVDHELIASEPFFVPSVPTGPVFG